MKLNCLLIIANFDLSDMVNMVFKNDMKQTRIEVPRLQSVESIHKFIDHFNKEQKNAHSDSKKLKLRDGPYAYDTFINGKIV